MYTCLFSPIFFGSCGSNLFSIVHFTVFPSICHLSRYMYHIGVCILQTIMFFCFRIKCDDRIYWMGMRRDYDGQAATRLLLLLLSYISLLIYHHERSRLAYECHHRHYRCHVDITPMSLLSREAD